MGQGMGCAGARCVVGAAGGWVLDCGDEINISNLPVTRIPQKKNPVHQQTISVGDATGFGASHRVEKKCDDEYEEDVVEAV